MSVDHDRTGRADDMATKAIQPRPGTWNGIEFRSQLEIKWAQWFDGLGLCWEYVDRSTHDFEVATESLWTIEVKPRVPSLCAAAVNRIATDFEEWPEGPVVLFVGNPPSPYGNGIALGCDFLTDARSGRPWLRMLPSFWRDPWMDGAEFNLRCLPFGMCYLVPPGDCTEKVCDWMIWYTERYTDGR